MATEESPLLDGKMARFPVPSFSRALPRPNGRSLPQAIAHRGYKAEFPENTLAAFRGAFQIGAHALETDLHLSKDKVVVLSHDADLKRCFGEETKIAECEWSYLSTLKTLREPKQPMPRLVDLLEYLSQPELQHMWLLLDFKRDDDAEELLGHVAKTIASVPSARPWTDRIVLGGWTANYLSLFKEYFPGFSIAYIGFSAIFASRFLKDPAINFNLLQHVLVGPVGRHFLRAAQKAERSVYGWTVNEEQWMEWSIKYGLDGVITDDPKLFLEVCDRWEDGDKPGGVGSARRTPRGKSLRLYAVAGLMQIITILTLMVFARRLTTVVKRKSVTASTS